MHDLGTTRSPSDEAVRRRPLANGSGTKKPAKRGSGPRRQRPRGRAGTNPRTGESRNRDAQRGTTTAEGQDGAARRREGTRPSDQLNQRSSTTSERDGASDSFLTLPSEVPGKHWEQVLRTARGGASPNPTARRKDFCGYRSSNFGSAKGVPSCRTKQTPRNTSTGMTKNVSNGMSA